MQHPLMQFISCALCLKNARYGHRELEGNPWSDPVERRLDQRLSVVVGWEVAGALWKRHGSSYPFPLLLWGVLAGFWSFPAISAINPLSHSAKSEESRRMRSVARRLTLIRFLCRDCLVALCKFHDGNHVVRPTLPCRGGRVKNIGDCDDFRNRARNQEPALPILPFFRRSRSFAGLVDS